MPETILEAETEKRSWTASPLAILVAVLLLATTAGLLLLEDSEDTEERTTQHTGKTSFTDRIIVVPHNEGIADELFMAAATPVVVSHEEGEVRYNPILLRQGGFDTGDEAKGNRRILELTPREPWVANLSDPVIGISELARANWDYTDSFVFVDSYPAAIAAAPLASYMNSPILYTPPDMTPDQETAVIEAILDIRSPDGANSLYVDEAVKVQGAPPGPRLALEQLNDHYLEILESDNLASDYIVVTNPADATEYDWPDREDKLPLPSISATAAELAAYHHGIILFAEGLDGIGIEFGDGFTLMGVERSIHNAKAEVIKERVVQGVELLEGHGMEAGYVCLVGGPVALPMYYEDAQAYTSERQYTPSDYHYANLDEDPFLELAPGRVMSVNAAETAALVARTLGFDEMKDYDYPADESSTVYDLVSEDWKENSFMAVGTTKIGPGPGILTPTLANQTKTQTEGGYHVTPLGYDLATQAETVKEIIDEMNYAVYYGHGNHNSWYTSVPDPIDSDMINAQELKPGFGIAMACLTGMTDNIDYPMTDYISMAFLRSGFNGYVGATRVAYGLYDYEVTDENVMRGTGALYLVDMYSKHICKNNEDVGRALVLAKNALIDEQGWEDFETQITVFEYQLYGDPAGNLHVPAFDA